MDKIVTKEIKDWLKKAYPPGEKWTFRPVIRVSRRDAFYKIGDIIKVKYFVTYGCYDHKDRWVDYWDVGQEVPKPANWKD